MIVLKILTLLLGIAFIGYGYFIYVQKRYSLINGFEEAYRSGRKTEAYAKRVGLVELVLGVVLLLVAALLIVLC